MTPNNVLGDPIFDTFDMTEDDETESRNSTAVSKTSLFDKVDGFFESIWNGVSDMFDSITNSNSTLAIAVEEASAKVENATTVTVNGTSTLVPDNIENSTIDGDESTAKKSKKAPKKATTAEAPDDGDEDDDDDEDYVEFTTKKSAKSKKARKDDDEE